MTFDIIGGGRVAGNTDQELVQAIRSAGELAPGTSVDEFMVGMAQRVSAEKDVIIRTGSVHDFLFDLQVHDFLIPVDDPWASLGLNGVKAALGGPAAPAGWQHRLVWSGELPVIMSSHSEGAVHSSIQVRRLAEPGYQEDWVKNHLHELRLYE